MTDMFDERFLFTERASPWCEVGYGDIRIATNVALWDTARWDDPLAKWAGTEPHWQDISCDVIEASCEYGRRASTDRYVPGTANIIVRNHDGWADPRRDGLRPGRAIRFGVVHVEFGKVVLYRGFIDAVIPTYQPWHLDTTELHCIDALGEVNRTTLEPLPAPADDNQAAHLRVGNILDRAKWPSNKRDISPTSWTLIAHEQGGQVADILGQITDSIGGAVWGDREGSIAFRPADWQRWKDQTHPIDATIGNVAWDDVCPGTWQRPFDRASISTRVIMGQTPETARIFDDIPGQALYGLECFTRTDLLTYDPLAIDELAQRTLEVRSHETAPRVRSVSIDARAGDAQIDLMTLADVYKPSHYRCRLMEDRGLVFDDRYLATAVAHRLLASEWTLEMNLDLAEPYKTVPRGWDGAKWDDRDDWSPPGGVPRRGVLANERRDERVLVWH